MKKSFFLVAVLIFFAAILCVAGYSIFNNKQTVPNEELKEETMPSEKSAEKTAVMIIAFRDFRDEEYFVPKEILEEAGIKVKTASDKRGTAIGADGGEAKVDILVSEINLADFNAIIFIGGPGALKSLDNEDSYKVARKTVDEEKILAAICVSPVVLAKAGVLEGKRATVWSSSMDKTAVNILKEKGAIYTGDPVVIDGKIITGNGPDAAREFGGKIIELLTGN